MMEATVDRFDDESERFNPFPGLRPFEPEEDHLFFGRERETDELLRRLRSNRFVSVLGTSGSGKSSLVRSGLIPSLYSGFMVKAGSTWRVAVLRPGEDPIGNLAQALNQEGVLGGDPEMAETGRMLIETTLRRSALGLADSVRHARLPEHENLLVVVDQFEELFRFRESRKEHGSRDEAIAFAKLLLGAAQQNELPVYVVVTMRSDFIGDCMEYPGLPEAINEGQYLIPRMTRDELRQAIAGPVAVGGGEIAPRLVARLLNEVGDDPDQLPVLQHALMRTWDHWTERSRDGRPLDIEDYEAIGTMAEALSRHAEEAYEELSSEGKREVAERLFKALTDKRKDDRGVRRPTPVQDAAAIAGVTEAEVAEVVEVFRRPGRSFLMPPAGVELTSESILDLSHESLMRNWTRLVDWVDEETISGKSYRRLCRAARRHEKGQGSLWVDPELAIGLQWREENKPTEVWARRYDPAFEQAMAFLDESKRSQDAARQAEERARVAKLRRARILAAVLGSAALITLAFGLLALRAGRIARAAEQVATQEAERSSAVTDFLISLFEIADPEEGRGDSITAREILDEGARKVDTELADQPAVQIQMLRTVGKVYGSLGLYDDARRLLQRSVELSEATLGQDAPETLESKYRLAGIYFDLSRLSDSEQMYEETLTAQRKVLGDEDPATLTTMTGMAEVYEELGQHQEAEETARHAFEIQQRVLGPDHADTLRSQHRMGSALFKQGRDKEAEQILAEVWRKQTDLLGAEAPDTVATMEELGEVFTALGRYDEAEQLYTDSLESRREVYGDEHPKTLVALARLSDLNLERGRWNECEAQRREVLEGRRRILGPEHLSTLKAETDLAWLLRLVDRLDEAEQLASHAVEASSRSLGPDHVEVREFANVLSAVYLNQGRYAKAVDILKENLEIYEEAYGPVHPATTTARNNLAVVYGNQNRDDEALAMYERNVEIQSEMLGEEHPQTLFSMNNYISALRDLRRLQEAMELSTINLERHQRVLGPDNPQTLTAMLQKGFTLGALSRNEEVMALADEYVAGHRRLFGDEHPETLDAIYGMSGLYINQGRIDEALGLRKEVLEGRKKLYGEDHRATINAYNGLAWTYQAKGDPKTALELRTHALQIRKRMADREAAGPQDKVRYASQLISAQKELQNPDQAVRYALQACEMTDYRNRNYVSTLAEAHFRAGDIERAIEAKQSALDLVAPDNTQVRNDYERRLAEFRVAGGDVEAKRQMQIAELDREREAAGKPDASPRAKNDYAWDLLNATPVDLRDPEEALRVALEVNEETGYEDTSLLTTLALAYHRTGQRDKAVETQRAALERINEEDTWSRVRNENRLLVYQYMGRQPGDVDPQAVLPGTWSGRVGPLDVQMEFRRNGRYIEAVNKIELPWLPADVVASRLDVETGECEIQASDQGWTNLRWEPADYLFTPDGELLVWHYEGMQVLRLAKD
jgi:tetratricopeptide (TPR) repeat protein